MLSKRRTWLERLANWGTALAVPLVAIIGFKLLLAARDPAASGAGQADALPATHAIAPVRVLSPPIDASAPPVVDLRSPAASGPPPARTAPAEVGDDRRCADLEGEIRQLDDAARRARDPDAMQRLRDRRQASLVEAQALRCRPR